VRAFGGEGVQTRAGDDSPCQLPGGEQRGVRCGKKTGRVKEGRKSSGVEEEKRQGEGRRDKSNGVEHSTVQQGILRA